MYDYDAMYGNLDLTALTRVVSVCSSSSAAFFKGIIFIGVYG